MFFINLILGSYLNIKIFLFKFSNLKFEIIKKLSFLEFLKKVLGYFFVFILKIYRLIYLNIVIYIIVIL